MERYPEMFRIDLDDLRLDRRASGSHGRRPASVVRGAAAVPRGRAGRGSQRLLPHQPRQHRPVRLRPHRRGRHRRAAGARAAARACGAWRRSASRHPRSRRCSTRARSRSTRCCNAGERSGEPTPAPTATATATGWSGSFRFRRRDDVGTYRAGGRRPDRRAAARVDLNAYADALVQGGIYPTTNTDPEVRRPFGFATVTNGGTKITNAAGIYDYTGGTATVDAQRPVLPDERHLRRHLARPTARPATSPSARAAAPTARRRASAAPATPTRRAPASTT